MRLFIDTDIGDDIDDALAIAYVLAKGYDVVGVTTVYREARNRVGAVRALLNSVGKSDVPVYAGYSAPVSKSAKVFGKLNYFVEDEKVDDAPDVAVKFLADCADKYGENLVVLAIGAQTNLAYAVTKYPDKMNKVGKVVIMGGCFTLHQNEWNIAQDPTAARVVAESDLPLVYVPWNVTKDLSLGKQNYDTLLNFCDNGLGGTLSGLVRMWNDNSECKYVPVLHDVAAAMCVTDCDFCTFADATFCVVDSGPACGLTLNCNTMNLFAVDDFAKKQISLVVSADGEKVAEEFMETVYKGRKK